MGDHRLSNIMADHRLSNMMGDHLGKTCRYWSCKLSTHCQQDVCMMPNNFTAVGLRDATLKDPNLARCLHTVHILPGT